MSENWSTSVNRFDLGFSSEGESQVGSTYGSFPLLSPRLEINAVANQVISDVIDHILEESINLATSSVSSQETNKENTMNNADYKAKVMELDDYTVNIESLIARFNKNTVSLLDLATYRQELKDIFDVFSLFERKYLELRGKLDRNSDNDIIRLNQLKELHERTKKRIVDNEVAVKKKLVELQNGNIHATAGDTDRIAKSKVQLKLKHATDKFKNLKTTIDNLGKVEDMSEHKVRECLVESKEWKKDLRTLREVKESIDLELLGVDIEEERKTEFDDGYKNMDDTVTKMITDLSKTDKELGLYSLSDGKSKSVVQYPEPII